MAKTDILDILRAKKMSPLEFNFDSLWIPPINNYLTPQDIESLRSIATSIRLSSKINQKYKMIDDIMRYRGFKRFSAGTNRVVYSFLEDDRFVVKIAVDRVGMGDNPREYENQFLLKPYVAKMFYVSPCGTVGFSERVMPIKNKNEFKEIAGDVFDILINKILGKYVMEDIGTKYFMNYGVRMGHAPVLLDFPYLYKLDGKKLFCTKIDPQTNLACNGEIDYDSGFNHLVCNRCGKIYLASDLRDNSVDNKIIIKRGGTQMKVVLKTGDQITGTPIQTDDVMVRPKSESSKNNRLVIAINDPKKGKITAPERTLLNENDKIKAKYNIGVSVNGVGVTTRRMEDSNNVEKFATSGNGTIIEDDCSKQADSVSGDTNTGNAGIIKSDNIDTLVDDGVNQTDSDSDNTANSDNTAIVEGNDIDISGDENNVDIPENTDGIGDEDTDKKLDNNTDISGDDTNGDNGTSDNDESLDKSSNTNTDNKDGVLDNLDPSADIKMDDKDSKPKVKTRTKPVRDAHGRFVSTKKDKTKSNFIPSR